MTDYDDDAILREAELFDKKRDKQLSQSKKRDVKQPQRATVDRVSMSTPIAPSNIGRQMLDKLAGGFVLGKDVLGVRPTRSDALREPIEIAHRAKRRGLGADQSDATHSRQDVVVDEQTFRKRRARQFADNRDNRDLTRALEAAAQLDAAADLPLSRFALAAPSETTNDDEDNEKPMPQVESVLQYLRATHLYCVWCGCAYQTSDELETQCPGIERDAH